MKSLLKIALSSVLVLNLMSSLFADNQTDTLSPVLPETSLPFTLEINTAPFTLPTGIQAYASATYGGYWFFISGRTNGLHGFGGVGNNFPPALQNTTVYVVNPATGASWSRDLNDVSSGLSQNEIDTLSVTAAQFFQKDSTLYVVGGYGINTTTSEMETKSTLTAIHLKNMIDWVMHGTPSAKQSIRQISDPLLQVTGGSLFQNDDHSPFLLMLGQNFIGLYEDSSNGIYTQQIRPFWLYDDGKQLLMFPYYSNQTLPDYRRRDLNILPIMRKDKPAYTAFAGVFTLTTGVWTVPITIFPDGSSFELSPTSSSTFKQAMNHYNCAAFGLYSVQTQDMYTIFPGGISFGYFSGGVFTTDSEFPFINQVTAIKIDKDENYTQFLIDNEYPIILSTGSNPGNQLLFGAEAQFFPVEHLPIFYNSVIQLDALPNDRPTVIGYIVGGIMSTLPNTNTITDSTASPYVFIVTYVPK